MRNRKRKRSGLRMMANRRDKVGKEQEWIADDE